MCSYVFAHLSIYKDKVKNKVFDKWTQLDRILIFFQFEWFCESGKIVVIINVLVIIMVEDEQV
jgi:hypothetical protein